MLNRPLPDRLFEALLAPLSPEEFIADYYDKQRPVLIPGPPDKFDAIYSLADLSSLLEARHLLKGMLSGFGTSPDRSPLGALGPQAVRGAPIEPDQIETVMNAGGTVLIGYSIVDADAGVPIIVNTSLNVAGEPIVESPDDALWCLLYTGIDCCVIGNHVVTKKPGCRSILDLYFSLTVKQIEVCWEPAKGPLGWGVTRPSGWDNQEDDQRPEDGSYIAFKVETPWGTKSHFLEPERLSFIRRADGTKTGSEILKAMQMRPARESRAADVGPGRIFDLIRTPCENSGHMTILASAGGRRLDIRLNKAFAVVISSEVDGEVAAVARNVSAGGMFVEMRDPPPLGTLVTVTFQPPDGGTALRASAEVKHHFCWNYQAGDQPAAARGVGLRFVEFLGDERSADAGSYARGEAVH